MFNSSQVRYHSSVHLSIEASDDILVYKAVNILNLCDIRDIRSLLDRHGFRFSKSMGQNFLIEPWVPEDIAASAGLSADVGVLEIGPGIGCLTEKLAQTAKQVAAVELDTSLLPVLAETLAKQKNVKIIPGDILKIDLTTLVSEQFAGLRPVVCANLPYNITTPILTRLIDSGHFEQITVMVQREVARRMAAPAGSGDYGAISLYMAYHTEPTLLFDVPPECFHPQPKVHSSVLTLRRREAPPVATDPANLFRVIKAAFATRRKTLANCLATALPNTSKAAFIEILQAQNLDPRIRGETLNLQEFAKLTDALLTAGML